MSGNVKLVVVVIVLVVVLNGIIAGLMTVFFPVSGADVLKDSGIIESGKELIFNTLDSLRQRSRKLQRDLFMSQVMLDSIKQQLAAKEELIKEYEKAIDELKKELEGLKKREEGIKELAKTYEAMKPVELKPILEKLDDRTIIDVYFNTSSRKRQNIMKALSPDRAARITKKIASMGVK